MVKFEILKHDNLYYVRKIYKRVIFPDKKYFVSFYDKTEYNDDFHKCLDYKILFAVKTLKEATDFVDELRREYRARNTEPEVIGVKY